MERVVYLDTHAVIWFYTGDLSFFPKRTLDLLEEKELRISPIVRLELGYLFETGKIAVKPDVLLDHLKEAIGLKICDQPFDKVVRAAAAESWTRDPFDRLIVAHAQVSHAGLVTKDETILKHYKKGIWNA